jgi:ATP-binding cassette subfamily F protein uup
MVRAYPGGYDDWLDQRPRPASTDALSVKPPKSPRSKQVANKPRKLGYMEQRELASLPQRLEDLESELESLFTAMSDPEFYKADKTKIAVMQARVQEVEALIAAGYERWEALDALQSP